MPASIAGVVRSDLRTRPKLSQQVKGKLKIVGQFGKEDLERLKKAVNWQLAMIEAALED